jgi:2-iminobutanoate/2-iminopropanoate deaminase
MRKQIVTGKKLPAAPSFISRAVKSGNLVFVCGMGPDNLNADIRKQTIDTLNSIKLILEEAGASMQDVLKVNVYLSDIKNYGVMNEEYSKFFPSNPPVRTCIQALNPLASKGQLIEIEAIAAI